MVDRCQSVGGASVKEVDAPRAVTGQISNNRSETPAPVVCPAIDVGFLCIAKEKSGSLTQLRARP